MQKCKLNLLCIFTICYLIFALSSPVFAQEYPICTEELPRADVEKGPTRPYPCNTCYEGYPGPLYVFCADQLKPLDTVTYLENEGTPDEPHMVTKTWGGSIEVDLTDTEFPLVGKTELEIEEKDLEDQARLFEYLADYFEGPAFYDQEPIDLETEDLEKLRQELRRAFTSSGVFRKLAPKELQDKLRENMITRAKGEEPRWPGPEDRIHNYVVVYVKNREIVSPDESGSEEIRLLDFEDYLRPIRENFPNGKEGDKEYKGALDDWKKKKIKGVSIEALWPYVPMFSRENVPGRADLQLEKEHEDDSLVITSPPENQKIYLPHLVRLKEVSEQVYKILRSVTQKFTSFKRPFIAQPKNLLRSDSKVLSSSDPSFTTCDWEEFSMTNPGDKICGRKITAQLSATEEFANPHYGQPPAPNPPPCVPVECYGPSDCAPYPGNLCVNGCCVSPLPPKSFTKDVSRKINVFTKIPLLDKLWEKIVAGEEGGILQSIFRIFFRHDPELDYDDYDYPGMGSAVYKYKDSVDNVEAGSGKKGDKARVYYKHLGGIRCIRDKVLARLFPQDYGFVPFCPEEKIEWPTRSPPTSCLDGGVVTDICCDYGAHIGNPNYIDVGDPNCNKGFCHIESFPEKEAPYGNCSYCNPGVCVRDDGQGGCAGICNWQCCQ